MRNSIEQHSDYELALARKIKELAQLLEEQRAQQPPSIKKTTVSTLDFSLPAYSRGVSKWADNSHAILATLLPAENERLFAIPEIDIYLALSPALPLNQASDLYPTGTSIGVHNALVDLDVWYDLWNNGGMGKQAATAFIRNTSPSPLNVKVILRWRFITQGAS